MPALEANLQTPFFDSLIDDFGIWQHTDGTTIMREEGYALDDASRGLLATLLLDRNKQSGVLLDYIRQSRTGDRFFGFCTSEHEFIKAPASDDATGQAIWALGLAFSKNFRREDVKAMWTELLPVLKSFPNIRGTAYALLGAVYFDDDISSLLAGQLAGKFEGLDEQWMWPEPEMTYATGIVPYCLLRYSLVVNDRYRDLALKLLAFVDAKSRHHGKPSPIGNEGWLTPAMDQAPLYSQQPIEAAYLVWAHTAAYELTRDTTHLTAAGQWMRWFEGENITGLPMINPVNNQCYDGIDAIGINTHSGAESNICLILSRWAADNQRSF